MQRSVRNALNEGTDTASIRAGLTFMGLDAMRQRGPALPQEKPC